MVVGRVLRANGCASCRTALLRRFASDLGLPLRVSPQRLPLRAIRSQSESDRRLFSSQSNFQNQNSGRGDSEVAVSDAEIEALESIQPEEVIENEKEVEAEVEVSSVPWYLQVESPQRAPKPLSERQRIPDLPESPPLVLQPLLQQISIDLGLDDLTLLDLRKLDPPPALGSNLLMIIGTTRSEKHLHVSADRLCRWLRSTYKLRPNADGLLGRNELKLKLKRKAKKAKLMGSAAVDNVDDGIRTGWVCVDVGVVESAETEPVSEQSDFVGFGRKSDGTRIVVQMLTEEKRNEMELEKLWGGILERANRKELADLDENAESESMISNDVAPTEPSIALPIHSSNHITSQTVSGTRGFHTLARRLEMMGEPTPQQDPVLLHDLSSDALRAIKPAELYESVNQYIEAGNYEIARLTLHKIKDHLTGLEGDRWSNFLLNKLRLKLEAVPKEQALEYLGAGSSDYTSTPFLSCFYRTLSDSPTASDARALIWLHCFAQSLGHPGYNSSGLIDLFNQLHASMAPIPTESYALLLAGVLHRDGQNGDSSGPSRVALGAATSIIRTMHTQGLNVLDDQVLVSLQEAVSPNESEASPGVPLHQDGAETFDLPSFQMSPVQHRLHILIMKLDLQCFQDQSRIRLLDLYWRHQHWVEFWDIWRMAPKRGKAQSPVLYAFMLGRVAQTGNQKGCMNVLRTWLPEMEREAQPVALEGQVAQAAMACLKVVMPNIEEAASDPAAKGEWISWWRKCIV
ncbi:uncharacterized protein BP5553_10061 [Venustampulla echinocandica]|uniref:ATPase synthesis protein 25 n=1 Tax=Venustampulla echinocandica TaxID=2656787 RepID=A0A370TA72_9HELO|nr:uncharacterized protein BP5553_10061 [Venustampulla echinocandica]RDL30716.1 hypothetical protein BP5553_10061 [Venustampulla echinocandica]